MQCQSLIEELSASHSTDLQQRAYELQAIIGLDARTVECIMPSDASCEDIEVTFNTSILDFYRFLDILRWKLSSSFVLLIMGCSYPFFSVTY